MTGRDMTSMGGGDARFPATLWSQILSARDPEHPANRTALDELIRRYWKPVYAYVLFQWAHDGDKAKDLTQAFFTVFIEKDFLKSVDPGKGNFRSFLKATLKHFLLNAKRDERRLKRGGDGVRIPFEEVQETVAHESDPAKDAEDAFDRAWRSTVLDQGIASLREELTAAGKQHQWQVFESIVLIKTDKPPTYEEVARKLKLNVTDVTNHLHAVRKKLRESLRRTLLEGLADPGDLDTEWRSVLHPERERKTPPR